MEKIKSFSTFITEDADNYPDREFAARTSSKPLTESVYDNLHTVKEFAAQRLSDFFRVPVKSLEKFKFDGTDDMTELHKVLNSTSEEGTKMYYEMAIKLSKEDVGDEEDTVK